VEEKKKKWVKGAVENAHGQFREKAEAAGESTGAYASEHEHDSGKLGKQARLAKTLMSMHHHHNKETTSHKKIMSGFYGKKD